MKIHFYESDPRFYKDPNFLINCGSFSVIIHNLNNELKRRGLYAELDSADWVCFTTGLDLNFCPNLKLNQKRAVIGVWESNVLPDYIYQSRKALEGPNYKFLALSKQYSDLMDNYGFGPTPIVDIGVSSFWDRTRPVLKYNKKDKFKILSVTANNFRSGVTSLINGFQDFCNLHGKDKCQLTIKDTEERNKLLPYYCKKLLDSGYDISYICERYNDYELKELMQQHHLLYYGVSQTSAGLPILNAARLKLPTVVGDFVPTNIYPSSERLPVCSNSISEMYEVFCGEDYGWGLPYTFPEGWVDKNKALLYVINPEKVTNTIQKIRDNYNDYLNKAELNYQEVKQNWSWSNSCDQLLKALL